ncbi:DUF3391 domain-containing protein [Candidatus Nitrospira bockiana]
MTLKRISVEQVCLGMYIAALDRPWYRTPFWRHRFLLRSERQIQKLRRSRVREVTIDLSKGRDIESSPAPATSAETRRPSRSLVPRLPVAPQMPSLLDELTVARSAHHRLTESVRAVFSHLEASGIVDREQIQEAARELVIVTRSLNASALLMAVSRPSAVEPSLSDHALTVSSLAMVLGHGLGYDFMSLHLLATGALLHDVGLLQLPPLLRSSGADVPDRDRATFESHPRLGALALETHGDFPPSVIRMVSEHHVTPDGHGYPKEYSWEATSEAGRVISVVDRYDELVKGGGQTTSFPHLVLTRLCRDARANRLDPRLVALFITCVGLYPVSTLVELNTGERGIVSGLSSSNLVRPIVTLLQDAYGIRYTRPIRIDLASDGDRTIARVLDPESEGVELEAFAGNGGASPHGLLPAS